MLIRRSHSLSVARQARLRGISHSSVSYRRAGSPERRDLTLVVAVDEIHTKLPFHGTRKIERECFTCTPPPDDSPGTPQQRPSYPGEGISSGILAFITFPKRSAGGPGSTVS